MSRFCDHCHEKPMFGMEECEGCGEERGCEECYVNGLCDLCVLAGVL